MKRATIAHGFEVDEEMFELVRKELGRCAPEQVATFTWERFATRESWAFAPDLKKSELAWYKAEMIVKRGAPTYKQVVKVNAWQAPDLRRDGKPTPHSHPWGFKSRILRGGYEEARYSVKNEGALLADPWSELNLGAVDVRLGCTHVAKGVNDISRTTFHEVTKILDSHTLTIMDCGRGEKDGWGYLDPDTGLYLPNKMSPMDPEFKKRRLALNPHLRKG